MNELVTEPPKLSNDARTLMSIIERAASTPDFDLDRIEKLLALKERWERNEAVKFFNAAMVAFKKDPPEVLKNKHVAFTTGRGTTAYDHATHYEVTTKISDALARYGFHFDWSMRQEANTITVRCTLNHVEGHTKSVELTAVNDGSGGKNEIQAVVSANTYLQRHTLLAVTGLSTQDMQDNDGRPKVEKEKTDINPDVWISLNDAAALGTENLRSQWVRLSEETRTAITSEYMERWNELKQLALKNNPPEYPQGVNR